MYSFWESALLGTFGHKGNPMYAHAKLKEEYKLTAKHFNHRKTLSMTTVDEYFEGDIVTFAKEKAGSIANLICKKKSITIIRLEWLNQKKIVFYK
jgi:hypothetical protein